LELPVDLVLIKDVRIELASHPFQHLVMLGVLWIADRFQKTRVAPDAPAILGRTGPFAREADGVTLPLVPRQDLFHEQLVLPAIPEIVFIEELVLSLDSVYERAMK
jgi:hypothetical protein